MKKLHLSLVFLSQVGFVLALVMTASCDDGGGGDDPTFSADVYPTIEDICTCHLGDAHVTGLLMGDVDLAYENLVGVEAFELPSMNRIEPGNADESYLAHKIAGTHVDVGGSGDQMPLGGDPLSDAVQATIRDWIDSGAEF